MRLSWEPLSLDLVQPFRIAHGVSHTRDNVLVRLDAGLGEAAAVSYHHETRQGIIEYLERIDLSAVADPLRLRDIIEQLPTGSLAARAALDMALHDAWGQSYNQPLYRLFGLDPTKIPLTSLTIPLGSPEAMAEQARLTDSPLLKIKLGSAEDEARVVAIAEVAQATLRADANAGWSLDRAERLLPLLYEHGIELIEQPLAVGDLEGLRTLSRLRQRPAIFADESIKSVSDILAHAGLVDGVVVKLAKSGGILGALEQITVARALGLQVMLGCMIESSVAVTAAAQIAALAQYVDLDAPLLIKNDRFEGVRYQKGRLLLPGLPGLGLRPRPSPHPAADDPDEQA
jgi:L-alanine-DL-glutamate epimerase-like enolase superfamily enzyme